MAEIAIRVDPFPDGEAYAVLCRAVWGSAPVADIAAILDRSLVHLGAYDRDRLVGFVNIAWDGGIHASIFDTAVHPDYRRRGIATALVRQAAEAARERGYDYFAVSDHSKKVAVADGLGVKRLARQIEQIDRLNEKLTGVRILKSCEVDILEDGGLDLPESVLERLDLTICAVHSKFDLSRDQQTERIIRAMDNPNFNILAHPTGRLLGERPAYDVDMERLIRAAKERGCFLEVNAQPERLDLTDVHCHLAKDNGVKVAISTDAHSAAGFDLIRFGIAQARRGWLEPDDVLNTRSWRDLKKLLQR